MVKNKIKWTTLDDVASKSASVDQKTDAIALQQQRIRVFKVTYNVSGGVSFLN